MSEKQREPCPTCGYIAGRKFTNGHLYSTATVLDLLRDGVDFNAPEVQLAFRTGRVGQYIDWHKSIRFRREICWLEDEEEDCP